MDATTMIFTMWIGSWNLRGQDDVFIGRALASDRSCQGVSLIRPTIDAKFEVIEDDAGGEPAGRNA
jgi:hypothetical protein